MVTIFQSALAAVLTLMTLISVIVVMALMTAMAVMAEGNNAYNGLFDKMDSSERPKIMAKKINSSLLWSDGVTCMYGISRDAIASKKKVTWLASWG